MIVSLGIRNFGSIREKQTLSFEADRSTHLEDQFVTYTASGLRLLKLVLIYGANASGKTTVLKALDFLRDLVLNPVEKKTDELDFNPFLFDTKTPNQTSNITIEFVQHEIRYLYDIEFSRKAIVHEELYFFDPNKASIFKRTTDLEKQFTEISFGSKIKKDKTFEKTLESNTLWNNSVFGGYLKTNIELLELKYAVDWFNEYLNLLVDSKTTLESFVVSSIEKQQIKKEDIIKILKKADFNISDIIIEDDPLDYPRFYELLKANHRKNSFLSTAVDSLSKPNRSLLTFNSTKITFEHTVGKKKYSLPFASESEGTKRYFEFAGLLCLLLTQSKAIPIDELEASLHPDLYLQFILSFLLNSKNSQVIATTHNREILSNKDIFRNDAIWFTDKSEGGATQLYSLADFDSSVIRDSSNILNAYKSGKLKGVPNLGDYYLDLAS